MHLSASTTAHLADIQHLSVPTSDIMRIQLIYCAIIGAVLAVPLPKDGSTGYSSFKNLIARNAVAALISPPEAPPTLSSLSTRGANFDVVYDGNDDKKGAVLTKRAQKTVTHSGDHQQRKKKTEANERAQKKATEERKARLERKKKEKETREKAIEVGDATPPKTKKKSNRTKQREKERLNKEKSSKTDSTLETEVSGDESGYLTDDSDGGVALR